MQPSRTIDPNLLDNASEFQEPFYQRFQLRHAPAPLQLSDTIAKNYLFPTFYGDVTCAQAIFLCPWDKAQRLLPHPKLQPVRMPGGRALVAFSCYIYRKVLGVLPYNEIAMTIPVLVDPSLPVPLLPMLWPGYPGFGYHVFSMPVTSLENQLRGLRIWGLPKVVQDIDIRAQGSDCITTALDDDSKPYFTLRVPTTGKPTQFDESAHLYSRLGPDLLQSRTAFQGEFHVHKRMDLLWKRGVQPETPYLTLGDSPAADALRSLELEPQAFQTRYAPRIQACFDLPNPQYRQPFRFD